MRRKITERQIEKYRTYLRKEEKSPATIEKYIRDIRHFYRFLSKGRITRDQVLAYKLHLQESYKPVSVNSMLAAVNQFLSFQGLEEYRVKALKIQKQVFRPAEQELTREEYQCLLKAARRQKTKQLYFIIKTLGATGIRISELQFITAEAVKKGYVQVSCKSKIRMIWIPAPLCRQLLVFLKREKIHTGPVFITRNKKPLTRSFVWARLKVLATEAGINPGKVYPHNLRHLFASTFYAKNKDIVKLSDILGHSSIDTTRIYTMTSGWEYADRIEQLGLL